MQHRAAALTSLAVELALGAAASTKRAVAVAGVLGSDMVSPVAANRFGEELREHAARLAAAGCELIIARGQGSPSGLMAAVTAATETDLVTWAVIECDEDGKLASGMDLKRLISGVAEAGARAVLFEVPSVNAGIEWLSDFQRVSATQSPAPGVLLGSSKLSVRGFPDRDGVAPRWVDRALDLSALGARIIGGGAGTTESHTEALTAALGVLHPSTPPRRPARAGGKA
jgi:5-methyltetrahydrofolate--homocysteine methyltransferase